MKFLAVFIFLGLVLAAHSTPQCVRDGESCARNTQCCSGDCDGWFHEATCKACSQGGVGCWRNFECCSGQCTGVTGRRCEHTRNS